MKKDLSIVLKIVDTFYVTSTHNFKYIALIFTLVFTGNFGICDELKQDKTRQTKNPIQNSKKEVCPETLQKWIEDDFEDQQAFKTRGLIYPTQVPYCQSELNSDLKSSLQKKQPSNSNELLNQLSDNFKQKINPLFKSKIESCQLENAEKQKALVTRFYASGSILENSNEQILDEVAFIDSVLSPASDMLKSMDCPADFPELKKKCEYQKQQAKVCTANQKSLMQGLVERTQKTIPEIENLNQLLHVCLNKFYQDPKNFRGRSLTQEALDKIQKTCDPISKLIEAKKNLIPWIRGPDFEKVAIQDKSEFKSKHRIKYDLSDSTIKDAISKQLLKNREALSSLYQSNIEDLRCIGGTSNKSCDYDDMRLRLSFQAPQNLKESDLNSETKSYFKAESCIQEKSLDRYKARTFVNGPVDGIIITGISAGLGGAASVMGRMSAGGESLGLTVSAESLRGLNMLLTTMLSFNNMGHIFQECINIHPDLNLNKETLNKISNTNLQCQITTKFQSQVNENESIQKCVSDAILSAPAILPLIQTVRAFKNFSSTETVVVHEFEQISTPHAELQSKPQWKPQSDSNFKLSKPSFSLKDYHQLSNDHFEVENVQKGPNGHDVLIIKRKSAWFDKKKDFTEDGADLTPDMRINVANLGEKEVQFFGQKYLDEKHIALPTTEELNAAIAKFNSKLGAKDPRRIEISFYKDQKAFSSDQFYVEQYVLKGQLPISQKSRQFFHDVTGHGLSGFYQNNLQMDFVKSQYQVWRAFADKFHSRPRSNFDIESFNKAEKEFYSRMAKDIDEQANLQFGYIPKHKYDGLRASAQDDAVAPATTNIESAKYGALTLKRSIEANTRVSIDAATGYKNNISKEFTDFYSKYEKKHPELLKKYPYNLDEDLKLMDKASTIRDSNAREKALHDIPSARPFIERLWYLRKLQAEEGR